MSNFVGNEHVSASVVAAHIKALMYVYVCVCF